MTSAVAQAPAGVALSGNASWVLCRERDRTVVTVEGELDSASAGAIAAALAAVGADASDVIVDMAHVDFIDLSGLDAVLRAHRLLEILGLSLTVRAPSRPVRHMLSVYQRQDLISPEAR
jgi:anti-anti-sigma factor